MSTHSATAPADRVKPHGNDAARHAAPDAAPAESAARRPYTSPTVQVHRLDQIVLGNNGRPFDALATGAQGGPGS